MDRLLIDYLPPVIRELREYQELLAAEQPELELLWTAADAALTDQFIELATKNGVQRWEQILRISPKATYTLDERKFTILAKLSEQLPYSVRMLERILAALCGEDGYKLEIEGYDVRVKVALMAKRNVEDVASMLRRVCPANMTVEASLLYNTWGLVRGLTWSELIAKTWREVKEEVL